MFINVFSLIKNINIFLFICMNIYINMHKCIQGARDAIYPQIYDSIISSVVSGNGHKNKRKNPLSIIKLKNKNLVFIKKLK